MNTFEETKIRMVMKLKKLTRRNAVVEIARMDAERHERDRGQRNSMVNLSRDEDDGFVSAEEFFR